MLLHLLVGLLVYLFINVHVEESKVFNRVMIHMICHVHTPLLNFFLTSNFLNLAKQFKDF